MADSDQNKHTEALNRNAASNEKLFARAEKKDKDEKKFNPSKLVGALAKNSAAVLGLSTGLTSLKGFFTQAVKDNQEITKQLSQFSTASTQGTRQMVNSFDTGFTTMKEGLATQGELIEMGMADLSKAQKEPFLAMKALGVATKGMMAITRFNTEALGMETTASVDLATSIGEAAIANESSITELVGAIQSMKSALTKTAVELGPEMSQKVQRVVARMTQNNSELAGAASQFVTSFLAGEEGFMKAARLGVGFTGIESDAELTRKIEELSTRILQMTAGAQGFGGGVVFQRLEDAFGVTRENVMIAQRLGTDIKELKRTSAVDNANQLKTLDASRQVEAAALTLQGKGVDIMQGVAQTLAPFAPFMPAALTLLGTIAAATQMMAFKGAEGGMLTAMKGKRGLGAHAFGLTMAATTAKDIYDVASKDDATRGDKWGAIGGVLAGAVGFAFGGPIGAGIAASIGNQLGNYLGDQSDDSGPGKSQKKMAEELNRIHGIDKDNEKNTAEIRKIQEEQQRRQKSLANPQISILTSINDVLVQNMIALQRANRQREQANETRKDMHFGTTLAPPSLSPSIGNF